MNQVVANNTIIPSISIREMLERIRENHVDIVPIIQEELDKILPQYIEEIVENMYNSMVKK